jgi:hypothetical protein
VSNEPLQLLDRRPDYGAGVRAELDALDPPF